MSARTTEYRLRAWIDMSVDASNWNGSTTYGYKFRINVNGDVLAPTQGSPAQTTDYSTAPFSTANCTQLPIVSLVGDNKSITQKIIDYMTEQGFNDSFIINIAGLVNRSQLGLHTKGDFKTQLTGIKETLGSSSNFASISNEQNEAMSTLFSHIFTILEYSLVEFDHGWVKFQEPYSGNLYVFNCDGNSFNPNNG